MTHARKPVIGKFILRVKIFALVFVFCVNMAYALDLKSSVFSNEAYIPDKYTCKGGNVSPPLEWNEVPGETESLALVMEDPDAPSGTWDHWVIYNIPANVNELEEGIPKEEELHNGIKQGLNDFGKIGYGGPCPPPGKAHRYIFKLYALNEKMDIPAGLNKENLIKKIREHIIGESKLTGLYKR